MTLTPAQRKLRAQIAANTRWSKEDPAPTARRGQAGLQARFEREVDPAGTLPAAERARRARAALKAHMQRLALASAKAVALARQPDAKMIDRSEYPERVTVALGGLHRYVEAFATSNHFDPETAVYALVELGLLGAGFIEVAGPGAPIEAVTVAESE